MNTTKSVYNRLFAESKVELASERVELGLVEDFKKLKSEAILESDVILDEYSKLSNLSSNLKNKIKKYINLTIDLSDKQNEISAKYKELGLDFSKDPQYSDYKRAFQNQKNILDIESKLKSI